MSIFKRRKKDEEKPLLLKGYVEKTQRVQKESSSKLEQRANLLYSDVLEPKKKAKKLEPVSFKVSYFNEQDDSGTLTTPELGNGRRKRDSNEKRTFKQRVNKTVDDAIYKATDFFIKDGYKKTAQVGTRLIGGIDADENLKMSMKNKYLETPFAQEHTIYNNVSEVSPFLRPYVVKKIKSQLGSEYLSTIKGLFVDSDKESARRLSENKDIHLFVKRNKDFLKNLGYIKNDSIQFTDSNFYNAIGKADIVDMYLTSNGEIIFYIVDTYDFNKNSDNPFVRGARKHQEKGNLIPYFIIYSVKLNKYTTERLLR